MLFIVTLLLILTISVLVTRVATIAFVHTGLSRESARFQARSAFTGAGFTTTESEQVVGHPVRRRIVMLLMLWGNAGLISAMSSVILTFLSEDQSSLIRRMVILFVGLAFLFVFTKSAWIDRHLSHIIDKALRRYTTIDVRDYASLMQLAGDYRLVEMQVEEGDWISGKVLSEARLRDEGIVVLGVRRVTGQFVGAPNGDTKIEARDVMILYGRESALISLDRRIANMTAERHHKRAVQTQELLVQEEEAEEQQTAGDATPDGSQERA